MKETKLSRKLAVLNDAVKWLRGEKLIANPGTVVRFWGGDEKTPITDGKGQAKPLLEEFFKLETAKAGCDVCARGALLVCLVHKENDFKMKDFLQASGKYDPKSKTDQRLSEMFTEKQLAMMENAFEVEHILELGEYDGEDEDEGDDEDYFGINVAILGKKLAKECVNFGTKYEDSNDRLMAIFENAIKNKGVFKP